MEGGQTTHYLALGHKNLYEKTGTVATKHIFAGSQRLFTDVYRSLSNSYELKLALAQLMGSAGLRTILSGVTSNLPPELVSWAKEAYQHLTGQEYTPYGQGGSSSPATDPSVPTLTP